MREFPDPVSACRQALPRVLNRLRDLPMLRSKDLTIHGRHG